MIEWDYPEPFLLNKTVAADDIDIMSHTNNVVYLKWMEEVAWGHSSSLGLGWDVYKELNRALVARKHEIEYLSATFLGEPLALATWITANDGRLTVTRSYQFVRLSDGVTVLRGKTLWVCVDIATGKAKRMPPEFSNGYKVACAALSAE